MRQRKVQATRIVLMMIMMMMMMVMTRVCVYLSRRVAAVTLLSFYLQIELSTKTTLRVYYRVDHFRERIRKIKDD